MEMIGIPTVGWAADQSATFPGVKELVVTPAEPLGYDWQRRRWICELDLCILWYLPERPNAHGLRLFLTPNPALIATTSVKF